MTTFRIFLTAYLAISVLLTIGMIGKERRPLRPGDAVVIALVNGILIYGLFFWC